MSSVVLNWNANPTLDSVDYYEVFRGTGSSVVFGSCTKKATVAATTWTDASVAYSTTYTYYVVAHNSVGESSPDGPVNITVGAPSSTYVQNLAGAPSLQEGTHSGRPAAATAGPLYVETDTKTLFRDNGASWDQIGGGSGTVTSVATGTGLTGGTITTTGTISLAAIANHDLLANTSGGSAAPVATTVTALIDDAIGSTQGDILYRGASAWVVLAPGSAGNVLQSGGAAANPSWTAGGAGTVTSVATGTGLTGGTITSTGTISLAAIANHDLLANTSGGSAAPVATTLTALIDDAIGSTQGDILYRGASSWAVLAPGTSGDVLQTGGASANPSWTTPSAGSGTVTSVGVSSTDLSVSGSPVTGSGSITLNVNSAAITNAKLATMATHTIKGNATGSTAAPTDMSATTTTALLDAVVGDSGSGGTKGLVPAPASGDAAASKFLKADGTWATVSGAAGGTVTSVATGTGLTGGTITSTGTISLAAIADHDLLANTSGGSAAPIATTLTALIDNAIASTQGDILYRNASAWVALAPGSAGTFLQTQGGSANPSWATAGSAGVSPISVDVRVYNAAGAPTWNKPAGALVVHVIARGGGGSGGSGAGAVAGTFRGGGTGGGGGVFVEAVFNAADLGSSETVTVGAGGASRSGGATTTGTDGQAGGTSSFGSHLSAFGGGGGKGGAVASGLQSGGGGGGTAGAGVAGANSGAVLGGSPATSAGSNGISGQGGGGATNAAGGAEYGGASGGAVTTTTAIAGGSSLYGSGGGGGGGLVTASSPGTAVAGGNGGSAQVYAGTAGVASTGGAVAGGTNGAGTGSGAGTAGGAADSTKGAQGGAGGGGNNSATGGAGGNGGNGGGGGGGGGGGTSTGGASGAGGDGYVVVISW